MNMLIDTFTANIFVWSNFTNVAIVWLAISIILLVIAFQQKENSKELEELEEVGDARKIAYYKKKVRVRRTICVLASLLSFVVAMLLLFNQVVKTLIDDIYKNTKQYANIDYKIAIIALFVVAMLIGLFLSKGKKDDSASGTDTAAKKVSESGLSLSTKIVALIGYGLFLFLIAISFPNFGREWRATDILFWAAHGTVTLLITYPIWQRGNSITKLMVATALAALVYSTIRTVSRVGL